MFRGIVERVIYNNKCLHLADKSILWMVKEPAETCLLQLEKHLRCKKLCSVNPRVRNHLKHIGLGEIYKGHPASKDRSAIK